MMTNSQELEQQIEKLVSDHIAACHKAVTAAVERAFMAAKSEPVPGQRRAKAASRVPRTRRSLEELAMLGEQFYAAVCAAPGETMSVLAAQLRTSSGSLQIPVGQLKRAGRVRSAGRRQFTSYFPMSMDETTTTTPLVAVGRAS